MIYTKSGDCGETSLVGGTRVSKCDIRVEAYGTVDELNSQIAVVAELDKHHHETLKRIQRELFIIQSLLATEDQNIYAQLPQLKQEHVSNLESEIDDIQEHLPKINTFVIAGGCMAGAQCHVARCVCRRAERRIVELSAHSFIDPVILQYVNRLSDYLFVLSRRLTLYEQNVENLF